MSSLSAAVRECRAQQECAAVSERIEQELSVVRADLEIVERELADVESKLPSDVKSEYRRIAQTVGENALAPVDDNTCGNCCTLLTSQVISDLKMSNIVFCKSCGSLLYVAENASV